MDRHITHAVFHTFAFLAFSCLAFSTLAFWCRIFMSRNFMSRIFSVPVVLSDDRPPLQRLARLPPPPVRRRGTKRPRTCQMWSTHASSAHRGRSGSAVLRPHTRHGSDCYTDKPRMRRNNNPFQQTGVGRRICCRPRTVPVNGDNVSTSTTRR